MPEIENALRRIVRGAAVEHNKLVKADNIEDFRYELRIDFAPLSESVTDYLEHSGYYWKVIDDEEIRSALSSECFYKIDL